jgi:glycosyltransferase involved in cell wall biosynthesis
MAAKKHGLKVLEVASSLYDWGGIERYVHYLDLGLSERGNRVTVVCPPRTPLAELTKHPECLFANRGKYSLRTYVGFRRIGRAIKPDIAHIHFSPDFLMPALALRQTTKAKIVMTRHLVLPWPKAKADRYSALFDHIIPVSHAVEKKLLDSGIPPGKMTVAKAGVPEAATEWLSPSNAPGFRIGCFGRLVAEKGVDVLLHALAKTTGIEADIYGDGPEKTNLLQLAQTLKVADRVRFHGFVKDVNGPMLEAHAVVVPSLWDEAFPYSILEAMAIGRAVVASNCGGIPEVVQNAATGRLFPKADSAALSEILTELKQDREGTAKMGRAGRDLQVREYTIGKMAERIEAVFREVVGQ